MPLRENLQNVAKICELHLLCQKANGANPQFDSCASHARQHHKRYVPEKRKSSSISRKKSRVWQANSTLRGIKVCLSAGIAAQYAVMNHVDESVAHRSFSARKRTAPTGELTPVRAMPYSTMKV
jgi:hypothetical protein